MFGNTLLAFFGRLRVKAGRLRKLQKCRETQFFLKNSPVEDNIFIISDVKLKKKNLFQTWAIFQRKKFDFFRHYVDENIFLPFILPREQDFVLTPSKKDQLFL